MSAISSKLTKILLFIVHVTYCPATRTLKHPKALLTTRTADSWLHAAGQEDPSLLQASVDTAHEADEADCLCEAANSAAHAWVLHPGLCCHLCPVADGAVKRAVAE